jgi:amidohydrolase
MRVMASAELAEIKGQIKASVDGQQSRLVKLSRRIHRHPETGFKEEKAAAWLTAYLKENGFSIEKGSGGMATAFKATYGQGDPRIAIMAEYDALPELGHACGHNIIATAAAGAAAAATKAVDEFGGTVIVFGTPAEELYGGKIILAQKGAFEDIDASMMVHPGTVDSATPEMMACAFLEVEFFGREAHAAAEPEAGINALEAMILSFNAINSLRQHIKGSARIHGIITDGGKTTNIVPAYSAASFLVRATEYEYLDELKVKVLNCFKGGAKASGARLKYRWGGMNYDPLRSNTRMAELFTENINSLGRRMTTGRDGHLHGSTDMGNVSQLLPSIHPFVAIAGDDVAGHSVEFARAAASKEGEKAILDSAKALAMTVADLLASPETLQAARKEFKGK